jgi:hypothetical protein
MSQTFEENIAAQFHATWSNCDPAVGKDPRKYSLDWYTEGVFYGVKMGTQIGLDVKTEDEKRTWNNTWNLGYAQGLHYAAYNASNITISDNHNLDVQYGAALMRELIVDMLHAAANSDRIRTEAKG